MHQVLYEYVDNNNQNNVAEIPQQQQACAKMLIRKQMDGLTKRQATEF
jgi:hypothetical protein